MFGALRLHGVARSNRLGLFNNNNNNTSYYQMVRHNTIINIIILTRAYLLGVFDIVRVSFLIVGHTHNLVDQTFVALTYQLRRSGLLF